MNEMLSYSLRPARMDDFGFLRNLHRATLREYVEQIWGWDESAQEKMLRERFDPTQQGRGLGSRIIRDLLAEADQAKASIRLTVLRPNPAKKLYERLGFVVVSEDEFRFTLRRELSPPNESASRSSK